jgi:Mlc titration factor MtfA (ptsG expression regulator)
MPADAEAPLRLMLPLILLFVLASAGLWLAGPTLMQRWRRARVRRQPFPPGWRAVLRERMPAFARLPADVQVRLKKHAQVLLAEVPFIGCGGLVVDDEVRVLVAVQASLLLLGRGDGGFEGLSQVLVYPGAFVVERTHTQADGTLRDERQVLSGESWQQGQVVLSWDDVLAGAADPEDGRNVVIHEFAHRLDQVTGMANGAPGFAPGAGSTAQRRQWARVLSAEFEALQRRLARGESGLIDPYAATNAAEFFAVTTELFFERPEALAAAHPALHEQLRGFHGVDPRQWRAVTPDLRPRAET